MKLSINARDINRAGEPSNDKPKSLIECAYRMLGKDIIHGTFLPGSKIKLEPLSARYDVSAGTIREALSLLVSDGLVTANAQRGFRVAEMSIEDFQDLVNTRLLLEVSALKTSIANGGDEWEGRVVSAFHRLSLAEQQLDEDDEGTFDLWELRNCEFHEALVSECDSKWTLRFREVLYRQSERYRRLTYTLHESPGRVAHSEHKAIYDLTLARKSEEATASLVEHIRSAVSFAKMSQLLLPSKIEAAFEKANKSRAEAARKAT